MLVKKWKDLGGRCIVGFRERWRGKKASVTYKRDPHTKQMGPTWRIRQFSIGWVLRLRNRVPRWPIRIVSLHFSEPIRRNKNQTLAGTLYFSRVYISNLAFGSPNQLLNTCLQLSESYLYFQMRSVWQEASMCVDCNNFVIHFPSQHIFQWIR